MNEEMMEYRIRILEKSYEDMTKALSGIVSEVKLAKWILGFAFAVLQPVFIGLIIYYLTH